MFLVDSLAKGTQRPLANWSAAGGGGRRREAKPEHRGGEVAAEEPRAPPPRSEEHRLRPLPVGLSQELRLTLLSRVEVELEQPTVTRCSLMSLQRTWQHLKSQAAAAEHRTRTEPGPGNSISGGSRWCILTPEAQHEVVLVVGRQLARDKRRGGGGQRDGGGGGGCWVSRGKASQGDQ